MQAAINPFADSEPFIPPTLGVERSQTRYLFLGLNLTERARIRQVTYLMGGGKEINTPGLARTHRFLRRGRITPLEKSFDAVPRGMEPEGSEVFDLPATPQDATSAVFSHANPLIGVTSYPGNELPQILYGSPNVGAGGALTGIVEIPALIGHVYKAELLLDDGVSYDRDVLRIQREIFPAYPELPATIYELLTLADGARGKTGIVGQVAEDVCASLELSITFASEVVEGVHAAMRDAGGVGRRYTDVELSLLEQLGIPRQDEAIKRAAQEQAETMTALRRIAEGQGTDVIGAIKLMIEAGAEDRKAFLAALEKKGDAEAPKRPRSRRPAEPAEDE